MTYKGKRKLLFRYLFSYPWTKTFQYPPPKGLLKEAIN